MKLSPTPEAIMATLKASHTRVSIWDGRLCFDFSDPDYDGTRSIDAFYMIDDLPGKETALKAYLEDLQSQQQIASAAVCQQVSSHTPERAAL